MALACAGAESLALSRGPSTTPSPSRAPNALRIVEKVKQLQYEVLQLRSETERLRNERERWTELRNAGTPRKIAATEDVTRDAARQADQAERSARDAGHRAFAEGKALEEAQREGGEHVRRAQEAARRAEEQLASAEASFVKWQSSLGDHGHGRRAEVLAKATARLEQVRANAAARRKVAEGDLAKETARADSEVAQERQKLDKLLRMAEAHAADGRNRYNAQVQKASQAALAAEKQRDEQIACAARRAERSGEAAVSKVRLANLSHETLQTKAAMRVEQATEESARRIEAALAREQWAREDHQKRAVAMQKRMAAATEARDLFFAQCEAVERTRDEQLDKLKEELAAKTAFWEHHARDAEADAARRIADVKAVTEKLEAGFTDSVAAAARRAEDLTQHAQQRAHEHRQVLDKALAKKQELLSSVVQHSGDRVAEAEALAKLQLAEATLRCEHSLQQADSELARTKDVASSRLREAVGQLMMYLDTEEANGRKDELITGNMNLELWIPIPSESPQCA
eukprot:TRINITY_DN101261_c0_g1_i1.p1 TRINITY_DN101261_c0_g1~~TRINITY_DN101261_c0_g1_i1.p1  ORF type:complete len:517 (+),score=149.56 TRINITY_DN101261_c0_g1_i1:53-1603(+)